MQMKNFMDKVMSKILNSFFLVAFTFSLVGCVALSPSATPADATRVSEQAAQYKARGVKSLGASAQTRKSLQPGQWVATLARSKSDPNEVTLQVMKVADISGSRVTIEMEQYASTNKGARTVLQQTVRNFPLQAKTAYSNSDAANVLKDIEIEKIRMMDEKGEVVTIPQLPFGIGSSAGDLLKSTVATGSIREEQCSTGSYRATKCLLVPFESRVLWMNDSGTTYAHSAVPVLGFLRSDSEKYDIETIGFGDKGAKILIR